MSRIFICGLGAVSPGGWGVPALRTALDKGEPVALKILKQPGTDRTFRGLAVPPPSPRPAYMAHARLRRASAVTHHAVGATLEALEEVRTRPTGLPRRMGLIVCSLIGCAQYSQRFFDETLKDPTTASPLVFPETVFNAPASHIAAVLGVTPVTYTLLGDPATFLLGLALAADWLTEDRVDGCVVVGAEESSWLLADAMRHFDREATMSEGAGALYLGTRGKESLGIELDRITDSHFFGGGKSAAAAAQAVRRELPAPVPGELLCDSQRGSGPIDPEEASVWRDWTGPRISPKRVLGEGLTAAAAWQCVAVCDKLQQGHCTAARVSVVGPHQQAIGARFVLNPT